jgi:phage terminase large subunit
MARRGSLKRTIKVAKGLNIPGEILQIPTPRVFAPLLAPGRYKGARGGRGSGKSHFFAEGVVRKAMRKNSLTGEGLRWACVREIQKSLEQSAMRLIKDKIYKFNLGHLFDIQRDRIIPPGRDGIISFAGMQNHTADSIKSYEGYDGAWVEEGHSLSAYSWGLLRPTIRRDFDPEVEWDASEIWVSWNPFSPDDPVDEFFSREDNPDAICVTANWMHNPFFPEVLRKEMEYDRRRDPDRYAHVWLGGYRKLSEARVFRNWRIEAFQVPSGARAYYGADWGYAQDPAVLIKAWLLEDQRTLLVEHEAWEVGCEIDQLPRLFDQVPGAREAVIRADSSRPDTISYVANRGFAVVPSIKGKGSVEDGVEFLKAHDIVVHPRCRHTSDELSFYSWATDPRTEKILHPPRLEDRENHLIDALRYAVEEVRRSGSMMDCL